MLWNLFRDYFCWLFDLILFLFGFPTTCHAYLLLFAAFLPSSFQILLDFWLLRRILWDFIGLFGSTTRFAYLAFFQIISLFRRTDIIFRLVFLLRKYLLRFQFGVFFLFEVYFALCGCLIVHICLLLALIDWLFLG